MVILTNLQIINAAESRTERKPPYMVSVNGQWKQPLERTISLGQKLKSQKGSAHCLTYPHLGLYPEKTINEKDTGTPSLTSNISARTIMCFLEILIYTFLSILLLLLLLSRFSHVRLHATP